MEDLIVALRTASADDIRHCQPSVTILIERMQYLQTMLQRPQLISTNDDSDCYLKIVPLQGRTRYVDAIEIGPETTIHQLRLRVHNWYGMPMENIVLMYKANSLNDDRKRLADYNILPLDSAGQKQQHRIDVILPIWRK
jgi:hypothetical protein